MFNLSQVRLFATLWTVASQAPLSVEFCSQEYWSLLSFSPPGDPPNPERLRGLPQGQADSLALGHLGGPPFFFFKSQKAFGILNQFQFMLPIKYPFINQVLPKCT